MHFTRPIVLGLLLLLGLLVSACGQPAPAPTAAQPPAVAPTTVPAPVQPTVSPTTASVSAENTIHTIKHALGETTIQGTPKRVVALEWSYAEDVLALGVQPVGVADIKGYNQWVKIPIALGADVKDVGTRQEPNLEAITQLKPDLIIAPSFRVEKTYTQLSAIAPTLAFNAYPTDGKTTQYDEMRATFMTIATVLGRKAEGETVLKDLDSHFATSAAQLEKLGKKGRSVAMAQAFSSSGAAQVRMFTNNSMGIQILEKLGLKNAWTDGFQQYGFTTVTVEALKDLNADFFYVVQDSDHVFKSSAIAPLWNSFTFVKEGRAYPLGGDTWLFGGPLSAKVLTDTIVKAYSGQPSAALTASPETRTIKHALGETKVTVPAQRVVVLDYSFLDALLTVGVTPAGAAVDATGGDRGAPPYLVPLLKDVTSIGSRAAPSFEKIVTVKPDLILADAFAHKDFYAQLAQIAPTLVYNSRLGTYDDLMAQTREIGELVGQASAAQAAVDAQHALVQRAKSQAKTDAPGIVLAVATANSTTLHSTTSFVGSLMERLGRKNNVAPRANQSQFEVDFEGLVALNPPTLVIFTGANETPKIREWAKNPLWNQLEAVKRGRVYEFDRDLWTRGRGTLALKLMIEQSLDSGLLADKEPATAYQFKTDGKASN